MMMQVQRFESGGFVLHKCLGQRVSAWYDDHGNLLDCESINKRDQSRQPSRRAVDLLKTLGRVFAQK